MSFGTESGLSNGLIATTHKHTHTYTLTHKWTHYHHTPTHTPRHGSGNVVRIVNTAPVEFPMTATVVPHSINEEMGSSGDVILGGDLWLVEGARRRAIDGTQVHRRAGLCKR